MASPIKDQRKSKRAARVLFPPSSPRQGNIYSHSSIEERPEDVAQLLISLDPTSSSQKIGLSGIEDSPKPSITSPSHGIRRKGKSSHSEETSKQVKPPCEAEYHYQRLTQAIRGSPALTRWTIYEWFYPNIDQEWYAHNEFILLLNSLNLQKMETGTRKQWRFVKKAMGYPRRFSPKFIQQERQKLEAHRQLVRGLRGSHSQSGNSQHTDQLDSSLDSSTSNAPDHLQLTLGNGQAPVVKAKSQLVQKKNRCLVWVTLPKPGAPIVRRRRNNNKNTTNFDSPIQEEDGEDEERAETKEKGDEMSIQNTQSDVSNASQNTQSSDSKMQVDENLSRKNSIADAVDMNQSQSDTQQANNSLEEGSSTENLSDSTAETNQDLSSKSNSEASVSGIANGRKKRYNPFEELQFDVVSGRVTKCKKDHTYTISLNKQLSDKTDTVTVEDVYVMSTENNRITAQKKGSQNPTYPLQVGFSPAKKRVRNLDWSIDSMDSNFSPSISRSPSVKMPYFTPEDRALAANVFYLLYSKERLLEKLKIAIGHYHTKKAQQTDSMDVNQNSSPVSLLELISIIADLTSQLNQISTQLKFQVSALSERQTFVQSCHTYASKRRSVLPVLARVGDEAFERNSTTLLRSLSEASAADSPPRIFGKKLSFDDTEMIKTDIKEKAADGLALLAMLNSEDDSPKKTEALHRAIDLLSSDDHENQSMVNVIKSSCSSILSKTN